MSTVFLVLVVLAGLYMVTRNKNQPSKSSAANPVSVYFETESVSVGKNSEFSVKIKINPQSEKITGIELNLSFGKDKINLQGLDKSSTFPFVLQQASINNNNGTASITVGVAVPPAIPASGISDVVTFRGKSKDVLGQGILKVEQTSKAAASGKEVNVIESYGSMMVDVTSPTPTPSGGNKPGDVNNDGVVNIIDIGIIIDNYGSSPPTDNKADLNKDNIVNIIDIGIVIDNYGK